MRRLTTIFIAGMVIAALLSARAQERISQDVCWKIRQEGTDHSQLMHTVHVLTNRYGPRLTASPSVKAAGELAIQQMSAWELKTDGLTKPPHSHRANVVVFS